MNQTEQNPIPEIPEHQEILEEIESVNEATQNKLEDLETEEVSEELSIENKLKAEIAEANDKYVRLYAEFDNYKRRTIKERRDLLQTAGKDVIVELLPVVDDFERAFKAMEKSDDIIAVKEGVTLIYQKLHNTLTQKGLKVMETKGEVFDPEFHEAITSIPAPSEDLKGKIVDELEKGYSLNDKVIRFAKVIVGA